MWVFSIVLPSLLLLCVANLRRLPHSIPVFSHVTACYCLPNVLLTLAARHTGTTACSYALVRRYAVFWCGNLLALALALTLPQFSGVGARTFLELTRFAYRSVPG